MKKHIYIQSLIVLLSFFFIFASQAQSQQTERKSWRFAVLGDSHVPSSDTLSEMIPFISADSVKFVLFAGDLVDGGLKCSKEELQQQLETWITIFSPLIKNGIKVYPIRGNHEDDAMDNINVWNKIFTDSLACPQNGPQGEVNLTYSFEYNNTLFIGIDNYVNLHAVNQEWLDTQLSSNTKPHIFVFGHEAAFKVFHSDCLDDDPVKRDSFWKSMVEAGVKTYFCGHDHFYNVSRIDDGDNDIQNDIFQTVVGSGGGWLMPKHNFNGDNSIYKPIEIIHKIEHGYAVVEVSGDGYDDLDVSITWKGRRYDSLNNKFIYLPINEIILYKANKLESNVSDFDQKKSFIFPNPASEYINISNYEGKYEILNSLGITVISNSHSGSRIDISSLENGLYFLKTNNSVNKFIIIK